MLFINQKSVQHYAITHHRDCRSLTLSLLKRKDVNTSNTVTV